MKSHHPNGLEIAIIGMSCRYPMAGDIEAFWEILEQGLETITVLDDEDLAAAGVDPVKAADPRYVRKASVLENAGHFDAAFFGFSPRDAAILDPQVRLFLEESWHCLENGGYNPVRHLGEIGVFAGMGCNTYYQNHLHPQRRHLSGIDDFLLMISNEKDFLPTHVSYKLDLRGPALNVQTGCSTSLVAVHLACQSLLNGECDMALAGGVSVDADQKSGYLYEEGGVHSPDGHCRAFDAAGMGTFKGNGLGVVLLKLLSGAVADRDHIHAVIKGSAINNDGAGKVGYTAPAIEGQARVISAALNIAGVEPGQVGYVETHGTATPLGDVIEIGALKQVFGNTAPGREVALGSVKTNMGHMDAASGVTGLIKAALCLYHRRLVPSLHFETPNPKIDFQRGPFRVNTRLRRWAGDFPLYCGVSSFGIGGTNAHVVLEEAAVTQTSIGSSRSWVPLVFSAGSARALEAVGDQLAAFIRAHPETRLEDLAFTLQVGRKRFSHRRALVCSGLDEAAIALETPSSDLLKGRICKAGERPVALMVSGHGAESLGMARELYDEEPVFRHWVDRCAEICLPLIGRDPRGILYPVSSPAARAEAAALLKQIRYSQPVIFIVAFALVKLLESWGIEPAAMIGQSSGEYVVACLAGVLSPEDALKLVTARGRLMQQLPEGSMLIVPLSEDEIRPLLGSELSLALINGDRISVVAGTPRSVSNLETRLEGRDLDCRRIQIAYAAHSHMSEPILEAYREQVARVSLNAPTRPYISNLTGTWITAAQTTDPDYWVRHLRETVRFSDGLKELLRQPELVLLEVGPGHGLSSLARGQAAFFHRQPVFHCLRGPQDPPDFRPLPETLAGLWLEGVRIDWERFQPADTRRRIPLPGYPFQRHAFWIPAPGQEEGPAHAVGIRREREVADWFYQVTWQRHAIPRPAGDAAPVYILVGEHMFGQRLAASLAREQVVLVRSGGAFRQLEDGSFEINPESDADLVRLFNHPATPPPVRVVYALGLSSERDEPAEPLTGPALMGLASLARVLGACPDECTLIVLGERAFEVIGHELLRPSAALLAGTLTVIGQEYTNLAMRYIDLDLATAEETLLEQVRAEILSGELVPVLALRGRRRWVRGFERRPPGPLEQGIPLLREGGVYLITGGLGRVGLALAASISAAGPATLMLMGHSPFPEPETWDAWIQAHDPKDPISHKIRRLRGIRDMGSTVHICRGDVACEEDMAAILDRADLLFGGLHGVIHGAGIVGQEAVHYIDDLDAAECARQFHAKIGGALVLERLLADRKPDFCLLMTSLASVLGGMGFFAYSAANAYLDALVERLRNQGRRNWLSLSWEAWRPAEEEICEQVSGLGASLTGLMIDDDDGTTILRYLHYYMDEGRVLISTGDLQRRSDLWQIDAEEPLFKFDMEVQTEEEDDTRREGSRPAYAAPSSDTEKAIARIWCDLLGFKRVGVSDNFFELGGHSLLATQMISRLRRTLGVTIPLRHLFKEPNVAGLAMLVDTRLAWNREEPSGEVVMEEGEI